jgi:hypothetical protein
MDQQRDEAVMRSVAHDGEFEQSGGFGGGVAGGEEGVNDDG